MSTDTPTTHGLTLADQPWRDPEYWPPTDLPHDDGDKMESPWHFRSTVLLLASYVAARGTQTDYFVGANMFLYYSEEQALNRDFKGPDLFIVKHVDGQRERLSWMVWREGGRLPDVIIELLSPSTEAYDLSEKKRIYEQTLRTWEYFCIAPEVERLFGWRRERSGYVPIEPDERGWLWSDELDLWLGPWQGTFLLQEATWPRWHHPDGSLVLLPEEAEKQRADTAQQQADAEKQRADTDQQQAETEKQRADTAQQQAQDAQQQANAEKQRADALEAEVARLRAAMAQQQGDAGG